MGIKCFNILAGLSLYVVTPIFGAMSRPFVLFFLLIAVTSCRPRILPPKPPGYFKVDTPAEHKYRVFDEPGFPYTFEYPVYGRVEKDTLPGYNGQDKRYWINLVFPGLGGVINITYKEITPQLPLYKLMQDAERFSGVHRVKTNDISGQDFVAGNVSGTLYTVEGNVASKYQFEATDSVKNFLLGGLYFDVTPNSDSLKPVTDFLERDIEHLLFTLRWRR